VRVLVTGGAGFIGSFLVDRLVGLGHHIRVLDSLDPQVHAGEGRTHLAPGAELVVGDVRDRRRAAEALDGVEAVVHAAAAVGVAQSLYRVEHFVDVNVKGTATLLDCLLERPAPRPRLVVLSSMTGYGEGVYRRPSDGRRLRVAIRTEEEVRRLGWEPVSPETRERLAAAPTPEDSALLAHNVYALTKRYQEELALNVGAVHRYPVVCLRLFNVYGPRQSLSNPYTGVLAIFLSRLLAGERPVVYEDGWQTRDFVSVHDVVDAILAALGSAAADGQVINIGSGVPRPVGDLARTLARLVGREDLPPRITDQFPLGAVRHCTADVERARCLLGFTPRVAFEDGVTELVAWAQSADRADRFGQADRELRRYGLLAPGRAAEGPGGTGR
jgi:dTDP-L-rhamnose 4-epimerase